MIPGDSRRTSMRVMRTAEATVTMLLDKSLNAKVNMNRTHIDLKIIKAVTPQANQNGNKFHFPYFNSALVNLCENPLIQQYFCTNL